ncbi:OLC1v1018499C1 [Oldenlandia corymbosa var. corymbosa]|uniref:OLC1v1018499C1 n=1 Tax=Oldenlandia corymbosa var. corymbosa TaxID=529605 RepID=A0AAV1EBR8_OLDCO|nr:OLC1v1018499C1 [Oldenlandia corymbosa var. corymbosa]
MIELSGVFFLRLSIFSIGFCFLRRLRKGIRGMALAAVSASKQPPSSSSSNPQATWLGSLLYNANKFEANQYPKRQKTITSDPYIKEDTNHHEDDHPHQSTTTTSVTHIVNDQEAQILQRKEEEMMVMKQPRTSVLTRKSTLRPTQLVVPAPLSCPAEMEIMIGKKYEREEFQLQGKGFAVASKKGKRAVMEDSHGVMLHIDSNPKQAFFVVVDGHGGRAAAEFVAENLGTNIMKEINNIENVAVGSLEEAEHHHIEQAIRRGYLVTDHQFLSQEVNKGGACAASVLVKDGEMYVGNVGDCKVILSRNGKAQCLTQDHRLTRPDERARIENSGGFLECRNGVWRVNGSLAVSRAIGDAYLKQHIISEPHTLSLPLTPDDSDCFLILASDGLWDKVGEQEAVDVVLASSSSRGGGGKKKEDQDEDDSAVEACKELVALSYRRGGVDDVTVMVIHLPNFFS